MAFRSRSRRTAGRRRGRVSRGRRRTRRMSAMVPMRQRLGRRR